MTPGDSGHEAYTAIAWGVGLSHERSDIAGAEGFHSLEGKMCTVMRGADALPGAFNQILKQPPDAILVLADRVFLHNRKRMMDFTTKNR